MTWLDYPGIFFVTSSLWVIGVILLLLFLFIIKKSKFRFIADALIICGIIYLAYFVVSLWISLGRPPLKTLGETRLWYALLLSIIGVVLFYTKKLWYILIISLAFAILFLSILYSNPDTFDKSLMPALQSPWFVPHVVVYIIGYVLLFVSFAFGIIGLLFLVFKKAVEEIINHADDIVYIGFAFITFGLLFGALWAKEAWGHYWTWDPKETWAFLTWLVYLLYIHFRINRKMNIKSSLWILSLSFVVLYICWFGVNELASAQNSVHVYSN